MTDKYRSLIIQLVRYCVSGGIAFGVDFGLLWLLTSVCHWHYLIGAAIGYTTGLIITYTLSIWWVFDQRRMQQQWVEFAVFVLIGLVGLALTQLCMWLFTSFVLGENLYLISKLITTGIVTLYNFLAKKIILFTKQ